VLFEIAMVRAFTDKNGSPEGKKCVYIAPTKVKFLRYVCCDDQQLAVGSMRREIQRLEEQI
jgi:hypothetical protein